MSPKEKLILKPVPTVFDAESRAHDDHHVSLRLWLRLLSSATQVENLIRQKLQASFNTTLPRFDLMAQLERSPRGQKMSELSQRMMVTGGNVTGITDSLEKEGLVMREVEPTDRRVYRVKLTAEGERQFRRMAAEHERWIMELFAPLSTKQKEQLMQLLGELKDRIRNLGDS